MGDEDGEGMWEVVVEDALARRPEEGEDDREEELALQTLREGS
jgi:hypothetical protein